MLATSSILSLALFAIVILGAVKVYKALINFFAKLFKKVAPEKIQRVTFIIVSISILIMAAPLLIPFGGPIRLIILSLYVLYCGCALWQIWAWINSFKKPTSK